MNIDILNLQETEISTNMNSKTLQIPGYVLELENNTLAKRVATYIGTNINY